MKNGDQDIRRIVDMPEWEGVLDALLSCDPGHADLIEALIRNLKPVESVYDCSIEYAIGLIHGKFDGANCTVELPETGWTTVRGRTTDLGNIYEMIYQGGKLKYEIERFTDSGNCEIMYCR